ncbi:MAG: hypothetical protein HY560_03845 [Gemmatimonadetes bacterium]|nr:hypothetical protein [Gemmatimonadota bacterium]
MRRWIIAAALGCAAVATAYLPPAVVDRDRPAWMYGLDQLPERRAARAIGEALDKTSRDLQGAERAQLLALEVKALGTRGGSSPALVFQGRWDVRVRAAMRATFDSLWHELQPVSTASGMVAVAGWGQGGPHITALPSVTDGRTCAVHLPAGFFAGRSNDPALRRGWLERGVAKCGYYAAFGLPGPTIERWLGDRRYDVAGALGWRSDVAPAEEPEEVPFLLRPVVTFFYFAFNPVWSSLRGPSLDALACAQGDMIRCRVVAFTPVGEPFWAVSPTLPRGVLAGFPWREGPAARYLSDLVREMGRDRFTRFWRSAAPVDSAFASAFGVSIEEWTRRWLRQQLRFVPARTAPGPGLVMQGLLVVLVAAAAVSLYSTRRQVA